MQAHDLSSSPPTSNDPPHIARQRQRSKGIHPTRRSPLTSETVCIIFARRPARSFEGTYVPCSQLTREICELFDVKERTVRDIWNRRSWAHITRPFCTTAEIAAEDSGSQPLINAGLIPAAQIRKRGRPRGSQDSIKRRQTAAKAMTSPEAPTPTTDDGEEEEGVWGGSREEFGVGSESMSSSGGFGERSVGSSGSELCSACEYSALDALPDAEDDFLLDARFHLALLPPVDPDAPLHLPPSRGLPDW